MIELFMGEMALNKFLEFLYPASNTERTEAYDIMFHLFHDVLTLSVNHPGLEVCAWVVFVLLVTLCPFFGALPLTWFDALYVTGDDLSPKSSFLVTQVVVRQLALGLGVFGGIVLCYQYRAVVKYDPKRPLSRRKATVLFFSLMQFPLIVSPIFGVCSGCLLAVNIEVSAFRVFSYITQVSIAVVYLLLVVNSVMFMRVTRYSLSLKNGLFAYWEPPYDLVDYCFFWLCGAALPFRRFEYNKVLIAVYIISIFWGIGLLVRRKNPVFCGLIASMSEAFLAYTFIDFSIFSFAAILIEQSAIDIVVGCVVLLFINVLLSGIYVGLQATVTAGYSSCITGSQVRDRLRETIKTPTDAVNALRSGVGLAFQGVCDRDILAWILQGRFSTRILPDIVRLCLVLEEEMAGFMLPKVNFGPLDLLPLKFMGFQWRQYQNYILDDDSTVVKNTVQVLRNLIQHCNQITDNLWTETDYEHYCLEEYGKELRNTAKTFKMYLTKHPHSEEIKKLWEEFTKNVVCEPTKCLWARTKPFEHITSPADTIYGFLSNRVEQVELRQKKFLYETPTERFLNKYTKSAMAPRRIAVAFIFIAFLVAILCSEGIFVATANAGWELYSNISTLSSLGLALSVDALQETDELIEMPIFAVIWQLLPNITAEEVNEMRAPLSFDAPFLSTRQVWFPILEGKNLSFSSYCPDIKFTLHTLSHMGSRVYGTFETRRCYLATVVTAGKKITELCRELESEWNVPIHTVATSWWLMLMIGMFITVTFVYGVVVAYSTVKLKRMLGALRIVTVDKEMRHERGEVRPWFTWAVLGVWIGWLLCALILSLTSMWASRKFARDLKVMMSIMLRTTDIMRASLNLMLLASLQIVDQEWRDFYYKGSMQTAELLMQYLNELDVDYVFMNLAPYNDWVNFSTTVFRYAHLMETKLYATNNYAYLMSRYILVCHTKTLISDTLSRLSEVGTIASFQLHSPYWIAILVCVILSICICIYSAYIEQKQSLWYYGACVLIRRQMVKPPTETYLIRDALTGSKPKYIDRIPLALLVRRGDGVIVMANQHVREFTHHTIDQTRGQRFSEFFDEETAKDYEIHAEPFDDDLELVTIKDVSQVRAAQGRSEALLDRMQPPLPYLPFRGTFIYLDFRLDGEDLRASEDPARLWESLESKAPFMRLFSSVAMYKAVAATGNSDCAVKAVCEVSRHVKKGFRLALTQGEITFVSNSDKNLIALPCGEPVRRAEDLVIQSTPGKIFVDADICAALSPDTYADLKDKIEEVAQ